MWKHVFLRQGIPERGNFFEADKILLVFPPETTLSLKAPGMAMRSKQIGSAKAASELR
jgi:hypothetical protein